MYAVLKFFWYFVSKNATLKVLVYVDVTEDACSWNNFQLGHSSFLVVEMAPKAMHITVQN